MKIAIVGAGVTGAYLHRLLRKKDHEIDLYDHPPKTKCGISPCAWGTSRPFFQLVSAAGLDPDKYVLRYLDYIVMDEHRVRADLLTFDKPALIADLRQGAEIKYSPLERDGYNVIIDATGVSRAFLPTIKDDLTLGCLQYRLQTEELLENRIKVGKIGYAWCFPLSEKEYHVGCGSLLSDPRTILKQLGWVENKNRKILCACAGRVRLTSPEKARPFVIRTAGKELWGVGEAIGCVAPLAGDGVVPGMRSAQILADCWAAPSKYQEAILREFGWMRRERRVLDKLQNGSLVHLGDAWILKKNSQRMGMQVGLKIARQLIEKMR